ncbi:MAG: hypothetical protein ACR2O6_02975, partial [Ilumatobacteraceae bacterium]
MVDKVETPDEPGRLRALADRLQLKRVLSRDILVLAALSGLALTQPLLDLFGQNPEFFVAQEIPRREILAFALVVTFLVPLICLAIELVAYAIDERVGRAAHVALVALLSSVLGLRIANELGAGDVLSIVIAVTVAAAVTMARVKLGWAEQLLRYLSVAL